MLYIQQRKRISQNRTCIDNIPLDDIETAFEGETGALEGCSSLNTPAPPNKVRTNTYFFSGGFTVKCSL